MNIKKRNLLILTSASLALLVLFFYGYTYFGKKDYESLMKAEWKVVSFGDPAISLLTPVELEDVTRPLTDEARAFMESQQIFSYHSGDLFIVVTHIHYIPGMAYDRQGPEKSVQNFDRLFGASNVTFGKQEFVMDDMPAKRLDGTFDIRGKLYEFTRVSVENGAVVRDVLVIVKQGDAHAAAFRKKMIGSIQVD